MVGNCWYFDNRHLKVMGDPVTIRGWCIDQLPTDQTSAENGILTTMAERWGLCIDP